MNLRNDNPSDRVGPVFGPQRHIVTHMGALPHRQVAVAFATLRASRDKPAVKLAFEFLVLTAVRPGEAWFGAWGHDRHPGPRLGHPGSPDEDKA